MSLPPKMNRGLPPLPSSEEPDSPLEYKLREFPLDEEEGISFVGNGSEENLEDDFEEISEDNTDFEDNIEEEPIKEEETAKSENNSKEKSTKNNNTNKKKFNLNLAKIPIPVFKFPKISYKKIIIIISAVIIGLFLIGKINSRSSPRSITEKNKDISYHYKREEYNGIAFSAKAKEDIIAKFQRVYKEKNGNIVLCETDNLELSQNHEQEVFLTCMNNTEDVKNTNHKKITDNVLEIK